MRSNAACLLRRPLTFSEAGGPDKHNFQHRRQKLPPILPLRSRYAVKLSAEWATVTLTLKR